MKELQITIKGLQEDKTDLENKVDKFTQYGRTANDQDYLEIISLLENWLQIKGQIECLNNVLNTIVTNNNTL